MSDKLSIYAVISDDSIASEGNGITHMPSYCPFLLFCCIPVGGFFAINAGFLIFLIGQVILLDTLVAISILVLFLRYLRIRCLQRMSLLCDSYNYSSKYFFVFTMFGMVCSEF